MQKKRVVIVVIAGLLIIAAIFAMINLKQIQQKGLGGFFKSIFSSGGEKRLDFLVIDFEELNALDYEILKDDIVCAGKDGVFVINLKGERLWSDSSVSFLKPCVKTDGNYILVVDLDEGGKCAVLYKDNKQIWKENFSQGIISADLSEDGCAVIVHNAENYKAEITVLKPSSQAGNKPDILFNKKSSTEYIIAASISRKSGQIILSGVTVDEDRIEGSLSFIDMESKNIYNVIKLDKDSYPDVFMKYIDDEIVITAGSNNLRKIRKAKTAGTDSDFNIDLWTDHSTYKINTLDVEGEHIVAASVNVGENLYSDNVESIILLMDIDGKSIKNIQFNETVKHIDIKKDIFAAGGTHHVSFYTVSGEKLYDYETLPEIQKVVIKDSDNFIIVTNKDIHILTAVPV